MQVLDLKQEEVLRHLLRDASPLLSLLAEELSMARGTCARIKVARLVAKAIGARGPISPMYTSALRELLLERARVVRDRHGRLWVLADVEVRMRGSKPQEYRFVYVPNGKQL
jgi:hypothetical protein